MRADLFDLVNRLLEVVVNYPKRAPTVITSITGIHYYKYKEVVDAGLLELVSVTRKRYNLRLTEKGRKFKEVYKRYITARTEMEEMLKPTEARALLVSPENLANLLP